MKATPGFRVQDRTYISDQQQSVQGT